MNAPRDYVIVGGGLAGGLLTLAIRHLQLRATVTLVERAERVAGNHTWAFHAADVPAAAAPFVRPLVAAAWPGYRVNFPGYTRRVDSPYAAVTSDRMTAALAACGADVLTGAEATEVSAGHVTLAGGELLRSRCVIDARGIAPGDVPAGCGFQKFVGLEVETERPWPDDVPTVMDAAVPQDDGFRFVYALPFAPHRVLVEDTAFSDRPELDRVGMRDRVAHAIDARGVGAWRVVREESGVLPMPWAGGVVEVNPAGPLVAGYRGGWFHPATGYSFPLAVRLALAVASVPPGGATVAAAALARRLAPRQRAARFLNRLLFTAVVPAERWRVFRRLYRSLPDPLMARFYALEFGTLDAARVFAGWPPPLSLFRRPEVRPCPA